MASTLELSRAHAREAQDDPADLFATMRAVVRCRRELRVVPEELLEELRAYQLATLLDSIDGYNARIRAVTRAVG